MPAHGDDLARVRTPTQRRHPVPSTASPFDFDYCAVPNGSGTTAPFRRLAYRIGSRQRSPMATQSDPGLTACRRGRFGARTVDGRIQRSALRRCGQHVTLGATGDTPRHGWRAGTRKPDASRTARPDKARAECASRPSKGSRRGPWPRRCAYRRPRPRSFSPASRPSTPLCHFTSVKTPLD